MKLQEQDVFAGRYRLLRRIGSGGFSIVWLAADQMTNDREVALKIYVPDKGMDRQGIKMFVREYEIVADMNHPGLLKATHFDVHDGSPFLVMPYCSGGSLHSRIMERGAMSEDEIAEVLEQTAGALAYLHQEEVVHQDIKPDNVLINDRGEYLLTDFGISSRLRSTMRKSTGRKESMTLSYAPPERFGGKGEILPAGDIFSLGVMVYELATADLPWMGAGGAILRPDSIPLELTEGYSRELETLMQACLSYSPLDRPSAIEIKGLASLYLKSGHWRKVSPSDNSGSQKVLDTIIDVGDNESRVFDSMAAKKAAEEIASNMVQIAGGPFKMGCTAEQSDDCDDDELPVQKVYVSDYQLNKYEVTQAQWRAIMGSDPVELYNQGCDRCPVEKVNWNDAQKFIRELNRISTGNYRLPTEAEWEYAARGGQQSRGYKYSGSDRIDAVVWYKGNSKAGNNYGSMGTTRLVGGKRANELGLYDMSGNVWEWCSDRYGSDYYGESPRNNPGGPSSGSSRVLRGGSWGSSARNCRVSFRSLSSPGYRNGSNGFRLAR